MGPGQPVAKREVVCVARTKEKAGKQCDSQPTGPRGASQLTLKLHRFELTPGFFFCKSLFTFLNFFLN